MTISQSINPHDTEIPPEGAVSLGKRVSFNYATGEETVSEEEFAVLEPRKRITPDEAAELQKEIERKEALGDAAEALHRLEAAGGPKVAKVTKDLQDAAEDSAALSLLERFPVTTSANLQAQFPTPPAPVIEGIIGEGEKLILGGGSKTHKTFCKLNLASAISTGGKWLGHQCRKGRVLFLNFEVGEARMAERTRLLEAAGVSMEGVTLWNLRGAKFDWPDLIQALESLTKRERYSLIILDPIYKLLGGANENDNTEVAGMLAEVEAIAVETGAAVAFAHHFSKGNKAETASMDRMSGAGAFARDPDAILTLTEHEEPNCYVLEATVRNYASPEPVVVEVQFPKFSARTDLDSTKLKAVRKHGGHNKKGGAETVVETLQLQGGNLTAGELAKALQVAKNIQERTAYKWMEKAQSAGFVESIQGLWKLTTSPTESNE